MKLLRSRRPETPVQAALRYSRRLVIMVVGGTLLLLGVVMIVTPGPAMLLIPIGLAILGLEFAWARRLLRRVKAGVANGLRGRTNGVRGGEPSGNGAAAQVAAKERAAESHAGHDST